MHESFGDINKNYITIFVLLVSQVAFEATKGTGFKGDIAIDAISMTTCGEYYNLLRFILICWYMQAKRGLFLLINIFSSLNFQRFLLVCWFF